MIKKNVPIVDKITPQIDYR